MSAKDLTQALANIKIMVQVLVATSPQHLHMYLKPPTTCTHMHTVHTHTYTHSDAYNTHRHMYSGTYNMGVTHIFIWVL